MSWRIFSLAAVVLFAGALAAADPPTTLPADSGRIGTAQLRISSASIDYVKLRTIQAGAGGADGGGQSDQKLVVIRLEVTNNGQSDLVYHTYNGTTDAARDHASLRYAPRQFVALLDFGIYEPDGIVHEATIKPGDSITDLLVFAVPASTDNLTLFLPQGNLGAYGVDLLLHVNLSSADAPAKP